MNISLIPRNKPFHHLHQHVLSTSQPPSESESKIDCSNFTQRTSAAWCARLPAITFTSLLSLSLAWPGPGLAPGCERCTLCGHYAHSGAAGAHGSALPRPRRAARRTQDTHWSPLDARTQRKLSLPSHFHPHSTGESEMDSSGYFN